MINQVYGDNVFRTTIVCIDEYDNKTPIGRIYNAYFEEGVNFHSTIELLLTLESMLESMNWPQSYSERRLFKSVEDAPEPKKAENEIREGKLATFSLRILFRQNSSWQGELVWHEGNQSESFRSAFELLMLINSAMSNE
ncbi:MAG: hypothetical protein J6M35_08380 [Clostridia bacterium]|nr:hypothetical protein [Clostridia bacterium]